MSNPAATRKHLPFILLLQAHILRTISEGPNSSRTFLSFSPAFIPALPCPASIQTNVQCAIAELKITAVKYLKQYSQGILGKCSSAAESCYTAIMA